MPGAVPSRPPPPLARSHCEREPCGEVGSLRQWQAYWFAVATLTFFGHRVSTAGRNVRRFLTRPARWLAPSFQRFLIAASRGPPCSQVPAVLRPLPSEPVSDALVQTRMGCMREPGTPVAPDCSPVARSYPGVTRRSLRLVFHSRSFKELKRVCAMSKKSSIEILHKLHVFNRL